MTIQRKPHDVGNGMLCASFGIDGCWLSAGVPHPRAGLVELTGASSFPADRDGEVDLVRAHRASLTEPASAMLHVADARTGTTDGDPAWQMQGTGWEAHVEAWAAAARPTVVQRYLLRAPGAGRLQLVFRGRLDVPGYAEITPGGPIPPRLPPTDVEPEHGMLRVRAPHAAGDIIARLEISSPGLHVGSWSLDSAGATLDVTWDEAVTDAQLLVTLTMTCGHQGVPASERGRPVTPQTLSAMSGLDRVEQGALRYTLGCTALEVPRGQCCIITDHRLLPLSWTRDAYYQAALLMAHAEEMPDAADTVERHIDWLWSSGRDGGDVWRRSHLTTGGVKDSGYQVDQQLYPILELLDFRRTTRAWPAGSPLRWGDEVRRVWQGLPRDDSGLAPGEENPADDPSGLPYLLSSQLLLTHVARGLAELETELGIEDLHLRDDAEETLAVVRSAFTCRGPFGAQWAYETDGRGTHRLYHDANDVPTALAPLWGLCEKTDPHWRSTMRFAFSSHNPGFVTGRPGGLGSAHTPGVWPLGDAQEWVVAVATGDRVRARSVIERILLVASADGMLPETYETGTGEWLARHWFAWPGSLVGLLNATFHRGKGPWAMPTPGHPRDR